MVTRVPLSAADPHGVPPGQPSPRDSHLHLLSAVPSYEAGPTVPRMPLSAVIVPTHRLLDAAATGLGLAARCAEAHDAQLVILRSGPAARSPLPASLAPRTSSPVLVIDLPTDFTPVFTGQATAAHVVETLHRTTDIGSKRNVGLLLGLLCGWQTALFLDDDISATRPWRTPEPEQLDIHPFLRLDDVLADFATYPDLQTVGYQQRDFRDNSVVCHARHLAGLPQDLFISGGATVVRCGPQLPFFSAAYNEDWLFFFSLIVNGRHRLPSSAVKVVGSVHQRPYYPFDPQRARSEELGDVLAEGLFELLPRPRAEILALACTSLYWEDVVRRRQDMILDVLQQLRPGHDDLSDVRRDARQSLLAALNVYRGAASAWATQLADYVRGFLLDTDLWQDLLASLAPATPLDALDLPEALTLLGLADHASWLPTRHSTSLRTPSLTVA